MSPSLPGSHCDLTEDRTTAVRLTYVSPLGSHPLCTDDHLVRILPLIMHAWGDAATSPVGYVHLPCVCSMLRQVLSPIYARWVYMDLR